MQITSMIAKTRERGRERETWSTLRITSGGVPNYEDMTTTLLVKGKRSTKRMIGRWIHVALVHGNLTYKTDDLILECD